MKKKGEKEKKEKVGGRGRERGRNAFDEGQVSVRDERCTR